MKLTSGAAAKALRPADLSDYLPAHWQVTQMWQRTAGNVVSGIMKVRCRTDKKTFLSDFEAHLRVNGEIESVYINGRRVRKTMLCE